MAQHDMIIDNGPGLAVRTDINAALQALVQQSSGPVEPSTQYPGMLWLDTTVAPNGLLWQRNQANNAWITPTVLPATAGNIVRTVITASGTYTKPADLKSLEVWCVGGGGGGGVAAATTAGQASGAGGGAGGGVASRLYKASDLAATVAYTVGAGGAGGTAGNGGNGLGGSPSTFAGLTGGGGNGGLFQAATPSPGIGAGGGASANAVGGDLNLRSEPGDTGIANPHNRIGFVLSGRGGSNFFATAVATPITNASAAGPAGNFPGGGGGGAGNGASQAIANGGAGGAGAIILTEYF
jgi:hypothetical protein